MHITYMDLLGVVLQLGFVCLRLRSGNVVKRITDVNLAEAYFLRFAHANIN